ncbi:CgeB family protein [Lysobacter olei]
MDLSKPVMMSVFDEFSRACFAPQASLIEPRPDNWEALLDRYSPKLLFVESSWKGNYGTWQYRVANYAHPPGRELKEMVAGCRARGIPTVFWNKEDPVHFSNFIEAAAGFDHVFTTAAEAVPMYRERTQAKVGVLQFAAEESLHNPIGSSNRNQRICFAGSFYANRFQERRDDQLMLLEAASRFDLDIYDRNHNPKATSRSDFEFPERFSPFIRPAIPYAEMGEAYRKYRVFLNVNSVIDSPTMFSRRVFELLACGTPVVSTWSRGIEQTFGDLVWLVKVREEADEALNVLMTDDREWRRRSIEGVRRVLGQHTFRHRFQDVLESVGIDFAYDDMPSTVQVLSLVSSVEEANAVLEAFTRQVMPAGVRNRLVLFCKGGGMPGRTVPNVDVVPVDDSLLFDEMAVHPSVDKNSVQALMLPTCVYGDFHLLDLLIGKRYSGAAMVGKARDNVPFNEYRFGIPLALGSVMFESSKLSLNGGSLEAWLHKEVPMSDSDARRTFAIDRDGFSVVGSVVDPVGIDLALSARY